jgi:hypothetical protein
MARLITERIAELRKEIAEIRSANQRASMSVPYHESRIASLRPAPVEPFAAKQRTIGSETCMRTCPAVALRLFLCSRQFFNLRTIRKQRANILPGTSSSGATEVARSPIACA